MKYATIINTYEKGLVILFNICFFKVIIILRFKNTVLILRFTPFFMNNQNFKQSPRKFLIC